MTVIPQRTESSCGVTALALLLADIAMRRVDPEMRGLAGLYNREVVAAAKVFGVRLRTTRRFDLDRDQGILRVRWKVGSEDRESSPYGHFVTVISGSIHCPLKHVVLPWREYCVTYAARPCTLLREAH